jgi:pseudaminic acid synthase
MIDIQIADRKIGLRHRPYLIAEMSGNHNRSLETALKLVDAAAACGVDAIKLQTYTADTMTLKTQASSFFIDDASSPWAGRHLYDLYQEANTPWDWHLPIIERAKTLGMHCFSTPFDDSAVDFLESLDVPAYKIASFECTDLPLIRKVAATGKPILISTGMATLGEIDEAVGTARSAGASQIVLLKCTSSYPADPNEANIATIPNLGAATNCLVGLSDHTMGCGVAVAAVALGATVIEKHFTLRRADGGVDASFSMEPEELTNLRIETDRAWRSLGIISYGNSKSEEKSKVFRRSLFISADTKAGDFLSARNVRIVRPGHGLAPKYYDIVLGKRINQDVKSGTPLSWDMLF